MDKLKPCPFCGWSAVLQTSGYDRIDSRPHDYAVCCTSCGASTRRHFPTLDEAAKAWNKRADTATEYPEYLPQVECHPYYQPKLPRNYKPDEDSMRRRDKMFSDIEQLGIKHNPDGSMEVAFKPQEGHNE